jgi:hypothetical protein
MGGEDAGEDSRAEGAGMIKWLFYQVWKHRLEPSERIIKVKGWRTALIQDTKWAKRYTGTFMIKVWKDRYI